MREDSRFREYFEAEVVDSFYVTPNMIRVRLGGDELRSWVSSGIPDERITIAIPGPDQPAPPRPRILDGRWVYEGSKPPTRAYSVRRVDPMAIIIDFVVHDGGTAAAWAARSRPGDIIGLSLGQGWYQPPCNTTEILLVGDATALPAMSRIVEEAPAGARIHVIGEVPTLYDKQILESRADVTYEWIFGTGLGCSPSSLPHALRATDFASKSTYFWIAAEARVTRLMRSHLRYEHNVPKRRLTATGYWH